jgi:esterase/lipase superfamily enzyme/acyl carrier protein
MKTKLSLWVFVLAVIVVLWQPTPGLANMDIVFAVDISREMEEGCPLEGGSPLQVAKKSIVAAAEALLLADREIRIGLLGFATGPAEVYNGPDFLVRDIPTALKTIESTGSEDSSLHIGLRESLKLLLENNGGGGSRIVIYTIGANDRELDDRSRDVLDLIAGLAANGIQVQINLFSDEAGSDLDALAVKDQVIINHFGCRATTRDPVRARLVDSVKTIVAQQTGADVVTVTESSDLLADLGAGQYETFEIVATLCDRYGIPLPSGEMPTTIDSIADYILGEQNMERKSAPEAIDPSHKQTIFYATNRKRTGSKEPIDFYGGKRADAPYIEYGSCEISIPANHKRGVMESSFLGLNFFRDDKQHIVLKSITPLSAESFFSTINTKINTGSEKSRLGRGDLVIYIHGYNTTFENAAKRTAQIAFDYGFQGVPLMFSWPSDGKLVSYPSDREDITWSVTHIEQFFNDVLTRTRAKRVHLIAHSMGNQGLIDALNTMALRRGGNGPPLFENIILSAPDFDAELFQQQIAPNSISLARRWTLYTSKKDGVLNISTSFNSSWRLGLSPVTIVPGMDIIDASEVEVTPWSLPESHSYFASKQTVVDDIIATLKGVTPARRNLLSRTKSGSTYWMIDTSPPK